MLNRLNTITSLMAAGFILIGTNLQAEFIPPATGGGAIVELDGNILDDGPGVDGVDWVNITSGTGYYDSTLIQDNGPTAERNDNNIFDKGSKDTQYVSKAEAAAAGSTSYWQWKNPNNHKATDKVDIVHASAAIFDSGGDMIIYLQADRFDNRGDAYLGAWLFKDKIVPVTSGPDKGTFYGSHSPGDILMLLSFENGGKNPNLKFYVWTENGLDTTGIDGSAYGYALTNAEGPVATGGEYSNYVAKGKSAPSGEFPTYTVFEGGINLSKFYRDNPQFGELPCFTTVMIESRNSSSIDAALEDFAIDNEFSTCKFSISKTCTDATINAAGTGVNYDYNITVSNTGFGALDVDITDDSGTPGNEGDDVVYSDVHVVDSTTITHQILNGPLNLTNIARAEALGMTMSDTANCTAVVDRNVTVDKKCNMKIDGDTIGSYAVVRVNFDGQVCNYGNTQIKNLTLNDSIKGDITASLEKTILAPGECTAYSDYLFPTAQGDKCAKDFGHSNEVTVTYTDSLTNETITTQPPYQAQCTLCDGNCQTD